MTHPIGRLNFGRIAITISVLLSEGSSLAGAIIADGGYCALSLKR